MISSASAELRDPEYDMVEALDNTAVGAWRPFFHGRRKLSSLAKQTFAKKLTTYDKEEWQ